MFVRAYLRASTEEQDANRAREQIQQFAAERGLTIAAFYVENESGASLKRPELFRLLDDCHAGDVLLIEQVDRLSRLNDADWETLKREIGARGVKIVALDLPTSWQSICSDETTSRIMAAVNNMLLDSHLALKGLHAKERKFDLQDTTSQNQENRVRSTWSESEQNGVQRPS